MERETVLLLLFCLVLGCCDRLSSKLGQSLEVFSAATVYQTVQEMDVACAEWAWDWALAYLHPPRALRDLSASPCPQAMAALCTALSSHSFPVDGWFCARDLRTRCSAWLQL